jgi:hypothetical protein
MMTTLAVVAVNLYPAPPFSFVPPQKPRTHNQIPRLAKQDNKREPGFETADPKNSEFN